MARVEVVVSLQDEPVGGIAAVVADLKQAGMQVEEELGEIGVVAGSVEENRLASLEKVRGVAHVERSRRFRIAPPEGKVQ